MAKKQKFYCTNCGEEVNEAALKCTNCGAEFESKTTTKEVLVFNCTNCGHEVSENADRCPNCGAIFGSAAAQENKPSKSFGDFIRGPKEEKEKIAAVANAFVKIGNFFKWFNIVCTSITLLCALILLLISPLTGLVYIILAVASFISCVMAAIVFYWLGYMLKYTCLK